MVTIDSGAEFSAEFGALSHIGQDESVGQELIRRRKRKTLCAIQERGNWSLEQRCAGVEKAFEGSVEKLNVEV